MFCGAHQAFKTSAEERWGAAQVYLALGWVGSAGRTDFDSNQRKDSECLRSLCKATHTTRRFLVARQIPAGKVMKSNGSTVAWNLLNRGTY
jgi:hypothetical protein